MIAIIQFLLCLGVAFCAEYVGEPPLICSFLAVITFKLSEILVEIKELEK